MIYLIKTVSPIDNTDYTRETDYEGDRMRLQQPTKKRHPVRLIIIIVLALVVLAGGGFAAWHMIQNAQNNRSKKVINQQQQKEPTPYHSAENGFTVNFMSEPKVTHDTIKGQGLEIPTVTYEDSQPSGSSYHIMVSTFKISEEQAKSKERAFLEAGLKAAAESTGGKVTTMTNGTLLGYPSATATAVGGNDGDMRITVIVKGTSVYALHASNVEQADFDKFVQSFKFD